MKSLYLILFAISFSVCFGQSQLDELLKRAEDIFWSDDYDGSLSYYDSASKLAIKEGNTEAYIKALMGMGRVYRYGGDPQYDRAFEYFNQALELSFNLSTISSLESADIYYNLATTERIRMNYANATDFGLKTISMAKQLNDPAFLAKSHHMLGNIFRDQQRYPESIDNLQKAISLANQHESIDEDFLFLYNRTLAGVYSDSRDFIKCINTLLENIEIINRHTPVVLTELANTFLEIGISYVNIGNPGLARTYLQNAFNINGGFPDDDRLSRYFWHTGQMFRLLNQNDSALHYFQRSLMPRIVDLKSINYMETPVLVEDSIHDKTLRQYIFQFLDDKGSTLLDKYFETGSIKYLNVALETYQLADDLMFKARLKNPEENPSLHLAEHFKIVYENALAVIFEVFKRTGDDEYLELAYNYIERNKQLMLLQDRLKAQQASYTLEFDSQIRKIQYDIDELRRKVSLSQNSRNESFTNIDYLLDQLVVLHTKRNELIRESGNLDFAIDDINRIDEIQHYLNPDQMILNYFWGDRHIFVLAISSNRILFEKIEVGTLSKIAEAFSEKVSNLDVALSYEYFDSFVNSGYVLYNKLFSQFIDHRNMSDMKEIIIIPDGKLNYIPVAALLRALPEKKVVNYAELSYLIKDFTISYSYSCSLLTSRTMVAEGSEKLLGFSTDLLAGTQKELNIVSSMWKKDNDLFQGEDATEANFKMHAPNYDILHLATHASSGDLVTPANIELLPDNASGEDGKLYAHELYLLDLNARMTVLSACETGVGTEFKGEGVFSLARSFVYAGSPTVIMSLWKVVDFRTAKLISMFYEELSQGKSVAESMRSSQLRYLNSGDQYDAHPSSWASFEVIGDGSLTFVENRSGNYLIYVLATVALAGLVVFARKVFFSKS